MKNEFTLAFNEVLEEKQLPKEIILQALESAMISAYRRAVNASNNQNVEAKVDVETGKVTIFAEKEVVDSVQDDRTEVVLDVARQYDPKAEMGDLVLVESTPTDFGRVAAQTARQVIQQRIRDAERASQLAHYEKQLGEIISGVVQAVNAQGLTIGLEMKAEGTMPRKETIPGERFRIHDRARALVSEVKDSPRGPQIILSRTHRNFLRRLLENEVPEIYHGVVEIRSIAREPGQRAKVAVSATQQGIDPVGACVGIRGVRIQAIVRELHDEKIDVIEWNSDQAAFIAKAISPARVSGVYLNEHSINGKTATVVVPEDQLSLAIGRDGQNARLAAKLTGWRIDIKSLPEAVADALGKLQNDPSMAAIAEAEAENVQAIEEIVAKKAEGRPLTPEEYDQMTRFVDRIEKRTLAQLLPEEKAAEDSLTAELRQTMAAEVFDRNILDSGLPEHVAYILQEAGFSTVGELIVQMKRNSDAILGLQGIGPKALQEITKLVETVTAPAPAVEQAPAEEVAPEEAAVAEAATAPVETAPTEATVAETAEPVVSTEAPAAEPAAEETVTAEEPSFDELFTMKSLEFAPTAESVAAEEDEEGKGKKKKKKGKSVEVVYDPDRDLTVAKKKHKRGDWDWEE
ncbi:MAG TPA: transcription termination factor NusA [Longilinea sp.]|nr:transcription termination factor NusA [Longilinea sp.]